MLLTFNIVIRCTAKDSDLEEDTGIAFRHRKHSEVLIQEFSIAKLWDEWGLVGDIIVSMNLVSHLHPHSHT